MKKVLYGICGIGNGHFFRQTPVIDFLLSQQTQILFFAYGESLKLLNRYQDNPLVKIVEVAVPYFIGNPQGLDFITTEQINKNFDYSINLKAFSETQSWLGNPDVVLTDYEPVSAQYGYAYGVNVITIDQQSKFFSRSTPPEINGFTCEDEIMRLNMFFPVARRLACSFFRVSEKNDVIIVPPLYRQSILEIKTKRQPVENQFVIYLSSQSGFKQSLEEVVSILAQTDSTQHFHIFSKEVLTRDLPSHVSVYPHGSSDFEKLLSSCSGVISTAGHNLLSECMYLNIPVYAMPMDLYEQQLNAKIIGDFCYGMNYPLLTSEKLREFISKQNFYLDNIRHSSILFQEDGKNKLLAYIKAYLNF